MNWIYYNSEKVSVPVPDSIKLGRHCLSTPTLDSTGIPAFLAKLAIVDPVVAIGDWVERGETIVKASIPIFDRIAPPSKFRFWEEDTHHYAEFELAAPVSGLILKFQSHHASYFGNPRYTNSGKSLCYGDSDILPLILLPDDEPKPNEWSELFYRSINDTLRTYFSKLLYSHNVGYIRIVDTIEERSESVREEVNEFISQSTSESYTQPSTRVEDIDKINNATRFVNDMRSGDLVLRKKLSHIGENAVQN